MTKYILHGGFALWDEPLNKEFWHTFISDLDDGANILLVYFARKDEEQEELFAKNKAMIASQAQGKQFNIVLATKDDFVDQLKQADAIYLAGGETQWLMDELKKLADFKDLIQNKVIAGSSAGAQIMATYYYRCSHGDVYEGLGILPIRLIPHYGSDYPEFVQGIDSIKLMNDYAQDLELVILKDFETKVIEQ